ncbi:MAG TPA: cell wall hydrolase [Sphingomicrobium sp.]|nr:cell wall hydrolase [Sphingomicrobium sp.]
MSLALFPIRGRKTVATAGFAGVALTASVLGAWIAVSGPAAATPDTAPIAPTRAAALLQATAGSGSEQFQAVGIEAKTINAALPFSSAPIAQAQPFFISGDATDRSRALLCLTQAVYYEAGFEPIEGRRAVAQVVLNRMRHPAFPKSICGVVYQGAGSGTCQFTFVCDGALYRRPAPDAWNEAEKVARAALSGYVERSVGEATHYHADYVAPRWAPLLAKVAAIGQHIFYRWPGSWGQPAAFSGRYIGEPRDPLAMRPAAPAAEAVLASTNVPEIQAGPPVPRADNDVGGLLDTSKGWTLHIPGPDEIGGAAKVIAEQRATPLPAKAIAAASVAGVKTGSR